MTTDDSIPRAILYSYPTSVWSTVALLCLHEKGYDEDEYIVKNVDITRGENFSPSYLKINMNGTIPTLVVPIAETTSSEIDSRYRSLRDTISICDFLDQARVANTQNTVSDRPAPVLSPATIEGKATADDIIALVHSPEVDPNFLNISARDENELNKKRNGRPGRLVQDRRDALEKYTGEVREQAKSGGSFETKTLAFLDQKAKTNEMVYKVYGGQASQEEIGAFYTAGRRIWAEGIPSALAQLESMIPEKASFVQGDQVSLADLHAVAWMTRIVALAGGKADASGIDTLANYIGGNGVGPKVRNFWALWVPRPSFQKVLVPAIELILNPDV